MHWPLRPTGVPVHRGTRPGLPNVRLCTHSPLIGNRRLLPYPETAPTARRAAACRQGSLICCSRRLVRQRSCHGCKVPGDGSIRKFENVHVARREKLTARLAQASIYCTETDTPSSGQSPLHALEGWAPARHSENIYVFRIPGQFNANNVCHTALFIPLLLLFTGKLVSCRQIHYRAH